MFIYGRHPTCVRAQTEAPVLVDEVGYAETNKILPSGLW
jgi:hypothetical protein